MYIKIRRRATQAAGLILGAGTVAAFVPASAADVGTAPAQASKSTTLAAPAGTSEAIAKRFDALVEAVSARLAAERAGGGNAPGDVVTLRAELAAARTRIEVLNAMVAEALVAQYATEAEALATRQESLAQVEALLAERKEADARNLMLTDQVEVLAGRLAELREEIDLLRSGAPLDEPAPEPGESDSGAVEPETRSQSFAFVGAAMAAPVEGFPTVDAIMARRPRTRPSQLPSSRSSRPRGRSTPWRSVASTSIRAAPP